jgi:hypothetical protein
MSFSYEIDFNVFDSPFNVIITKVACPLIIACAFFTVYGGEID